MVLKNITILGVLCTAFAGELSPAKTLDGPGRQAHVKLLSHAVVQGSVVRLADLLPSTAPVKLRAGCLLLGRVHPTLPQAQSMQHKNHCPC